MSARAAAAHWLDVIPVPTPVQAGTHAVLVTSQSVLRGSDRAAARILVCRIDDRGHALAVDARRIGKGEVKRWNADWLVPDLDTANGFGYALRWLFGRIEETRISRDPWGRLFADGVIHRHLWGTTTDADRLALATACREVTP